MRKSLRKRGAERVVLLSGRVRQARPFECMKTLSAKRRRKSLDDLARAEVRDGTYDRIPSRSEIARKAGSTTTPKKSKAARANGRKGGRRPGWGNPEIKRIMQERGVSRQRAHQILSSRARTGPSSRA